MNTPKDIDIVDLIADAITATKHEIQSVRHVMAETVLEQELNLNRMRVRNICFNLCKDYHLRPFDHEEINQARTPHAIAGLVFARLQAKHASHHELEPAPHLPSAGPSWMNLSRYGITVDRAA